MLQAEYGTGASLASVHDAEAPLPQLHVREIPMIILALDALDLQQVRRFNCRNLMQKERGQPDLSDFEQARTVVLWASFLTG